MSKFKNGEDYYNQIYLVFNALIAVSLLPFSFLLLEMQNPTFDNTILDNSISYLIIVLTILVTSFFSFGSFKQIKEIKKQISEQFSLRKKLEIYKSNIVRHYIILSLFCFIVTVVLYFIPSNLLIVYYVFLLVLLSINRPTLKRIIEDLKLSIAEQEILYQKSDIGT